MMVMCGSKERCRSEWSELLEAGGFRLDAVHPLSNGMCIVAARPI